MDSLARTSITLEPVILERARRHARRERRSVSKIIQDALEKALPKDDSTQQPAGALVAAAK